jgi:hypothetical protein
MGIIIGFAITFTTGSYLNRSEKIREVIIRMGQLFTLTKEEMQGHAKVFYNIQISHLKRERKWWFSGLGIIVILIFQPIFWEYLQFFIAL